jgi:glycosyltransferase involved in cell wall biosynthesis
LMGVPVVTVYQPDNRHVSNVTASILYHTDPALYNQYACASLDDYQQTLMSFVQPATPEEATAQRQSLRRAFLSAMDPIAFMNDYESVLEQLHHTGPRLRQEEQEDSYPPLSAAALSSIRILPKGVHADLLDAFVAMGASLHTYENPTQPDVTFSMDDTITLPASLHDRNMDNPLHFSYIKNKKLPEVVDPYTSSDLISCSTMGIATVIAPSQMVSRYITKQHASIIPPVIPLGVNTRVFKPASTPDDRDDLRESYGIPTDAFVFFHIGSMNTVTPLLRAFYDLACSKTNVYLILKHSSCAEDVESERHITEAIQTLLADQNHVDVNIWKYNVSKRIICMVDWMEQCDLAEVYALSDVYVAGSDSLTSGTSMMLEALASQVRLIAPKAHAIEEVAPLPRDVVTYISSNCNHEQMTRKMEQAMLMSASSSGMDYVKEHYTWERVATKLMRLFHARLKTSQPTMITSQVLRQALIYGAADRQRAVEHMPLKQANKVDYTVIDHGPVSLYILDTKDAKVFFEEIHSSPSKPFILVTLNTKVNVSEWSLQYIDTSPYLVTWFAHNVCTRHVKLQCLPVGLEAEQLETFARVHATHCRLYKTNRPQQQEQLCYVGCDVKVNPQKRLTTKALAKHFTWHDPTICYKTYLTMLAAHRYAVCAEGEGVDTPRFWECLYLGVIPIVLRSTWADSWKDKVRMVMVDSWDKVTPEFLEQAPENGYTLSSCVNVTHYKRLIELYATTGVVISKAEKDAFTFEACLQQLRQYYHGVVVLHGTDNSELQELQELSARYTTLVSSKASFKQVMIEHDLNAAFFITTNVMVYRNLTEFVADLQDECSVSVHRSSNGIVFIPSKKAAVSTLTVQLPSDQFPSLSNEITKSVKKTMAALELSEPEDLNAWSTVRHTCSTKSALSIGKHAKLKARKVVDLGTIAAP